MMRVTIVILVSTNRIRIQRDNETGNIDFGGIAELMGCHEYHVGKKWANQEDEYQPTCEGGRGE